MLTAYDQDMENLVKTLVPHWTEMRVKYDIFKKPDASPLIVTDVFFVGEPGLVCCADAKSCEDVGGYDYFPIGLVSPIALPRAADDYVTLVQAGGRSDLDRRLQWLFDHPSLRLIETEQEYYDDMSPDAHCQILHYYGGLELRDQSGKKALRILVMDESSFALELQIIA